MLVGAAIAAMAVLCVLAYNLTGTVALTAGAYQDKGDYPMNVRVQSQSREETLRAVVFRRRTALLQAAFWGHCER